jgi:hypothetical protein
LLEKSRRKFPDDFDIAWALATILRDEHRLDEGHAVARELADRFPGDRGAQALLNSFQSQRK